MSEDVEKLIKGLELTGGIFDYIITPDNSKLLLDYITKLQNNWDKLKNCVIDLFNTSQDTAYLDVLEKIQEFEKDNNVNTSN